MQHNRLTIWMVMLAALACLVFVGCGDDDDSNPTGSSSGPSVQPALADGIDAPVSNLQASGNQYCSMAAVYISMAQGFSPFFGPSAGASKHHYPGQAQDDSTVYTWSEGGMTVKMVFKETTTQYIWYAIVSGADPDDGTTYNDFKLIEAREYKTGMSGWMKAWDADTGELAIEWTWSLVSNVFGMTMVVYDGNDTLSIEVDVNADGSGRCEFFEDGTSVWWVTWNADGTSGQYYADGITGTWEYTG